MMESLEYIARTNEDRFKLADGVIGHATKGIDSYVDSGEFENIGALTGIINHAKGMQYETLVNMKRGFEDDRRHLEIKANTDALTGLPNRGYYDKVLADEIKRAQRGFEKEYSFGIIVIDIDYFKGFNDTYGHSAGDEVLKKVARICGECPKRSTDVVARYGGEEFVFVLPDTNYEGAATVAERVRSTICEKPMYFVDENGNDVEKVVSVSAGFTVYQPGDDPKKIFERADGRLYLAKKLGRNRVVGED